MILVDTSVWIEVFRVRRPLDLAAIVPLGDVATCLPIVQEILQGIRDETAFRAIRESLNNLVILENPLTASLFDEAVGLYRAARRRGLTVRSSVDCLIAAVALRHDVEVLHRDRDFASLARIAAMRVRTP